MFFFKIDRKYYFNVCLELLRLRFERFQGYMRFSYIFIYASTAGCYKFYYSTMHKNVKMCYCLQVLKGLIMLCYALNSPSYFLRFDFKLHISIKTAQQMFFK